MALFNSSFDFGNHSTCLQRMSAPHGRKHARHPQPHHRAAARGRTDGRLTKGSLVHARSTQTAAIQRRIDFTTPRTKQIRSISLSVAATAALFNSGVNFEIELRPYALYCARNRKGKSFYFLIKSPIAHCADLRPEIFLGPELSSSSNAEQGDGWDRAFQFPSRWLHRTC